MEKYLAEVDQAIAAAACDVHAGSVRILMEELYYERKGNVPDVEEMVNGFLQQCRNAAKFVAESLAKTAS